MAILYSRRLRWQTAFGATLPTNLACLAACGYGIYRAYLGYTKYGPVPAWMWSRPWLLLASLMLTLSLAIFLLARYSQSGTIVLRRSGLVLYKPFRKARFLPWTQIRGITFTQAGRPSSSQPLRSRAMLITGQGERLSLAPYCPPEKLPELVTRLKARLYARLETILRADLQAGKALEFGALALNKKGVTAGKGNKHQESSFTWDQIRRITIHSGHLVIEPDTAGALRLPVGRIPNLELLILLAREAAENSQGIPETG